MRAILVGIWKDKESREEVKESLKELKGLVKALGGKTLGYVIQKRNSPDPRYFIGEGKAKDLSLIVKGIGADAIIFDDPLTSSQIRNIESLIPVKILDRSDLVLEIFSKRVRTKEAKLQVELAKLTHELPRIYGRGKELSRLGGSVGTRGPGEQESEIRRRLIKAKIHRIKKELQEVRKRRKEQRKRREKEKNTIKVAITGYTNAGKSTLMNALTKSKVLIADMPFATLDTKTAVRYTSEGVKLIFTDTVGFIKKIPPELIESFKATLEEVKEADLILHVVDISVGNWLDNIKTVKDILAEIGAGDKPVLYALNKADKLIDSPEDLNSLTHPLLVDSKGIPISAEKGWGINKLIEEIIRFSSDISESEGESG